MSKSIIIIGAGIAGLAAGCYGQMNGYSTELFELHTLPGGLCTSWKRKGYTFDGCITWLVGSNKSSGMYEMWEELGAVQSKKFVYHEEFTRIKGSDGKTFIVYTNVDKLENHMKELAPEDSEVIAEWCGVIRQLSKADFALDADLAAFIKEPKKLMKMWPLIKNMSKYRKISVEDFAAKFKNPFMSEAIIRIFGVKDFPVVLLLFTLAWLNVKNAGFPVGGSLEFARGIEKRYLELEGTIHYKSPVEKILVENNKAIGVRLSDGREFFADYVISAADGHKTIFEMLEEKYLNDKIRGYYRDLPIFKPEIQVSLGINRDLSDEPHTVKVPLAEPIGAGSEKQTDLYVKHYCFDPTLAPEGKSTVVVMLSADYNYWSKIHQEPEKYIAEKERLAAEVTGHLEKLYPGISSEIEVVDVSTPVTYERYTGNWQGSMEGWFPTTQNLGLKIEKTLPGLENFYMAGQWVEPGGGVPTAALSGRKVIKMICKADDKKFSARKS